MALGNSLLPQSQQQSTPGGANTMPSHLPPKLAMLMQDQGQLQALIQQLALLGPAPQGDTPTLQIAGQAQPATAQTADNTALGQALTGGR